MVKSVNKGAVGKAHSKLILMGEHAVVYNEPAIAVPFDTLKVEAKIIEKVGAVQFISRFFTGELDDIPDKMEGLKECIKAVCKRLNKQLNNFQVEVDSSIPIGRGLGSSAAIAVSLVRGLYMFFNKNLSQDELVEFVDLAETFAHGTPSGIDRDQTTRKHPIFFQKGKEVERVSMGRPLHLIVADTGRVGDTHASVASVKKLYETFKEKTEERIQRIGELTIKARKLIEDGSLVELGKILDRAHQELKELGVSDPGLDHYVEVSKDAGALGAKLTGGGRGGCMFALAESLDQANVIEEALQAAGASKTWYCQITDEVMSYEG